MPRPCIHRRIRFRHKARYFKPSGVEKKDLEEIELKHDEAEALRLKHLMGLSQEECAEKMGISQPTFNRILNSARKKMADAMINGKAIKIDL